MTAYLQPGDKIHITVPGDWGSRAVGQRKLEKIVKAYEDLGINVFQATPVIHSEQVAVVCVIRDPVKTTPPAPPQIPLIHDPGDKFRARWNPPWQDPDK